MKKIVTILLTVLSMGLIFISCDSQKPLANSSPPPSSTQETKLDDPNRPKGNVPGEISVIKLRPDSQKVETKNYTCFFLYDKIHSCLYVTIHRALFEKIVEWMPEEVHEPKNSVLIVGTLIDPFTLITREELETNQPLKKILELNGYKVYAIFSYNHYPIGVPPELLTELGEQYVSQGPFQENPNNIQQSPTHPNSTEGAHRRVYRP